MITCLRIPNWRIWAARRLSESPPEELILHRAGRVTACSDSPLARGVMVGMPVARAEALAHEATLQEDPGARAELAWEEAVEDVNEITPRLEAPRPGLIWARLNGTAEPEVLAENLPACLGQAGDRTTALLASVAAQKGQVVRVERGQEQLFAANLPTLKLLELPTEDIDGDTVQRLIWLGFPRVGELRRLSREQLMSRFHCGAALFGLSRPDPGGEGVAFYLPAPRLRVERLAEGVWSEPGPVLEAVKDGLVELRELTEGRRASSLSLTLEEPDGTRWRERRVLKEPTSALSRWWTPLRICLEGRFQGLEGFELERLSIEAGGLVSGSTRQLKLWKSKETIQSSLQTLYRRFPGKVLRLDWHPGVGGLPEESWSFRPDDGVKRP